MTEERKYFQKLNLKKRKFIQNLLPANMQSQ